MTLYYQDYEPHSHCIVRSGCRQLSLIMTFSIFLNVPLSCSNPALTFPQHNKRPHAIITSLLKLIITARGSLKNCIKIDVNRLELSSTSEN